LHEAACLVNQVNHQVHHQVITKLPPVLSGNVQAMSEELVDVGLLHHITAICQQLGSSCCSSGIGSMVQSAEHGGGAQIQAAVAGYLMAAVEHNSLVEALGGPLQVAQLLLTMLLSCIADRCPS
jgi:hypothetical protein